MYKITYPDHLITRMITPDRWLILPPYTMVVENLLESDVELLTTVGVTVEKTNDRHVISLPEKQASDLGSIPKFLQWWKDPWDIAEPAIFHDHIHESANIYLGMKPTKEKLAIYNKARALSDQLLHDGVRCLNRTSPYNAKLVYYAVRAVSIIRGFQRRLSQIN